MPLPKFLAYLPVDTQRREAYALVERDAAGIWQRDACKRGVKAAFGQLRDQPKIEGASDPRPVGLIGDVDRDIDRLPVGGARSMLAGIGVSDDLAV